MDENKRSIKPAASITIPIKMNNGTAISWSFNMVEFVFSVISKPVSLKFKPQIPKPNAKKINVKDIGKPMNMTKIIAPSIIKPIMGFAISNMPPRSKRPVTHSNIGRMSGINISIAITVAFRNIRTSTIVNSSRSATNSTFIIDCT